MLVPAAAFGTANEKLASSAPLNLSETSGCTVKVSVVWKLWVGLNDDNITGDCLPNLSAKTTPTWYVLLCFILWYLYWFSVNWSRPWVDPCSVYPFLAIPNV